MLPVTFQFIIPMVAHTLNERMARRLDYLQEEVRVVKEALALASGKQRIEFTADQRRRPECTDHFPIFGRPHLQHLLKEFVRHYQTEPYHQGIDGRLVNNSLPVPSNGNAASGAIRNPIAARRFAQLLPWSRCMTRPIWVPPFSSSGSSAPTW